MAWRSLPKAVGNSSPRALRVLLLPSTVKDWSFKSGSNGTVSYATIKNATTGIWATGSSTTISIHDNVISDNGNGVHLTTTGTNVLITENVIEDNTIGMWLYQSNAVVSGNIIESNTYGMNADYVSSTAEHDGNKVRYNTTRGLFLNASNLWVTNSVFAGNGANLASGIYVYRLQVSGSGQIITGKMMLLK